MSDFRERIEKLSPKKLTLLALQLQARIEELEQRSVEAIAIIGLGCRIPGAEDGSEGFWDLLAEGRDAISAIPADRWDAAAYYDSDPDAPGSTATLCGSFLPAIDRFDAGFFGISPREAIGMDPQQRLLVEVCWEALEHAGQSPRKLAGSPTGVFVGLSTNDYYNLLLTRGEQAIDAYVATGTAHSVAAGRVSYILGLQGPSMAIDTSCSASLVSVHLACQSLRARECSLALGGGVNAILSPEVTIALSKAHMMAPDGRSKAFDSRADGFVRGEGCGMVVLKRLSDALADGDRILAVIRGSAVNQDGRSSGLTAPNGSAQEAVIRQALANAGVRPEEISYVEAHGTGTSLGDPIEAHALASVLGAGRSAANPLTVGSVKTNLGHLESAAGIAGLIKTVLSLQHQQIPKHLHFHALNPHIDWAGIPVEIPVEARPWPSGGRKRLAGVSSFGFSGTNAHVIVEEAPVAEPSKRERERPLHILTVSARSQTALRTLTERYAEELEHDEADLGDICFTANAGRAQFEHRAVYVAATRGEMRDRLGGEPLARGQKNGSVEAAFLFPGQGAQYAGMGKELYDTHPEFRHVLEECSELLKGELEEPLLEVLWGSRTGLLEQTQYTQPALFAVEYGIAQLWRSWGIEPAAVVGHSVGEYVAACVAGVYGLAEGLKLIARRGRLMQGVQGRGAMAAAMAREERVKEALEGLEQQVSIAALNAAESVVIGGYEEGVREAEERLQRRGVRVERLAVSHGFHSPQMAEMGRGFEQEVKGIKFSPPRVELISSVTGKAVGAAEMGESGYWGRQVREPVRFAAAMETLKAKGYGVFVEAGPGSTLSGLGKQTIAGEETLWAPTLRKGRGEWRQMLESLGRLWARGAEVDWAGFDKPYHRRRTTLPTYPFERQRYWIENTVRRPDEFAVGSSSVTERAPDDWFYKLAWEPKPYRSTPKPVQSTEDLATSLSRQASVLRVGQGLDVYDALRGELNLVCTDFITLALRANGWEFPIGVRVAEQELLVRCGIAERHRMLFGRLLEILVEDGIFARDGDSFQTLRNPPPGRPAAAIEDLKAKYPAFQAELEMTARCAASLGSVLSGQSDPLGLLFPGGSFETAEAIYSHSPGPQVFNRLAAEVVAAEVKARPDGSLRALEIGAGTGGTTAYVAPILPAGRTEYNFTDVSSLFRARAKEKFKDCPFFHYRPLDIEKDPATQGFQNEQFDIAIAANVLHATADLRETLRHIRQLLSPGGIIVLVEGTYPERWVDLTFGLTEGWWRFRDSELRRRYPLLPRQNWLDLLTESGFTDTGAIQPAEGSHQCVFFARASSVESTAGRWLIMPNSSSIAQDLARQVERANGLAVVAGPGESADQYLKSGAWDHIVDLQAVDPNGLSDLSPEQVGEAALSHAAGPIESLQAILRNQVLGKLWVVTRGAQAAIPSQAEFSMTQSTAWGVARCIGLEHPNVWGGVLDLDPGASGEENAWRCVASILRNDGEDQVAFRNLQRYVPRLIRSTHSPRRPLKIRGDGAYLVTGGLGQLGLRVAHWLVESGARHIVLAGRTGLPDRHAGDILAPESAQARRVAAVTAMEDLGATVTVAAVDVTDEAAVTSLFEQLPDKLCGVIHAAAALGGRSVKDMTRDELAAIMRAKTQGTWVLHQATASMDLDFFVLFSSSTSLLGSRDLAHYAAANQFLDVFAHYRQSIGLPAVAINWGAWPALGSASERDRDKFFRGGLIPMQWSQALKALGDVIALKEWQIAVGQFDWSVLKPLYESQRSLPILEHMSGSAQVSREPRAASAPPRNALVAEYRAGTELDREQALVRYLATALAAILGTEAAAIDPARPVTDFGVDSLLALEFKNRISSDLEFTVSTVRILQGPSLREIASLIAGTSSAPVRAPIEISTPSDEYPLSCGQQAQWFAHKFMPDSSTFNVAFTAKASPCIAWNRLERALEKLTARHAALRTIFIENDEGRPMQRVLPSARPDTVLIDASEWTDEGLREAVLNEFRRTFQLDRPMFRVCVFRRPDSDVLLFNVDHLIIDAWSLRLCFAELKLLYAAELNETEVELPAIESDYRDFVEWEATLCESLEGEQLWTYWSRQLGGELPVLRLPSSHARPTVLVAQGECIPLTLGASISSGVQRVAREHTATTYAVLLATFDVLLHLYTGQDEIVVGTSVSGRENPRWASAVGYFVNLLPIRVRLTDNLVFAEHLRHTRDTVLAALEHQDFPFTRMVSQLRSRRNLERSPIFQAFFNFLTDRSGELGPLFMGVRDCAVEFGASTLTPSIVIPQQEGQSEIVLQLTQVEGELIGNLNYNTGILDRKVAEEMAETYCNLLTSVIRDPNARIDDLAPPRTSPDSELENIVL